jgi:hypothetical protein
MVTPLIEMVCKMSPHTEPVSILVGYFSKVKDKTIKLVEIIYVGTHEKAPY